MTIPLQFASLYDGQEVFVSSDCLLDHGTDFLVGNMLVVVVSLCETTVLAIVAKQPTEGRNFILRKMSSVETSRRSNYKVLSWIMWKN